MIVKPLEGLRSVVAHPSAGRDIAELQSDGLKPAPQNHPSFD